MAPEQRPRRKGNSSSTFLPFFTFSPVNSPSSYRAHLQRIPDLSLLPPTFIGIPSLRATPKTPQDALPPLLHRLLLLLLLPTPSPRTSSNRRGTISPLQSHQHRPTKRADPWKRTTSRSPLRRRDGRTDRESRRNRRRRAVLPSLLPLPPILQGRSAPLHRTTLRPGAGMGMVLH